ncbi:hypothetical protein K438DRAFT_133903 [Mycena galopus ATCC 62051]|nr:hypothetical protein K438DRAFT_133903 [Mycena galopus ATCC 62051]
MSVRDVHPLQRSFSPILPSVYLALHLRLLPFLRLSPSRSLWLWLSLPTLITLPFPSSCSAPHRSRCSTDSHISRKHHVFCGNNRTSSALRDHARARDGALPPVSYEVQHTAFRRIGSECVPPILLISASVELPLSLVHAYRTSVPSSPPVLRSYPNRRGYRPALHTPKHETAARSRPARVGHLLWCAPVSPIRVLRRILRSQSSSGNLGECFDFEMRRRAGL